MTGTDVLTTWPTSSAYRSAARTFASGVTVVSTRYRGQVEAKTVSAFCSLSLEPAMVSVTIGTNSPLIWAIRSTRRFGISVLHDSQPDVSRHFARSAADRPDETLPDFVDTGGTPVLADCLSWFTCELAAAVPAGDHQILIGHVTDVETRPGRPLIHHGGGYRYLGPDLETTT
ncbi:flavin reductase family protein [Micromonospora arborensis]|uniref:flavin reductase family protein n=1 Tax=Micromonospora arborensis TaxID=2116518 RepID=UPI00342C8BED